MNEEQQYIIALKAQLQDMASTGLIKLNKNISAVGTTTDTTAQKTEDYGKIIEKAGMRALIVAPIWLLLRSAMMLALGTIGDMIKANIDLEEGMARISTVMQGSASEVEAEMVGIQRTILDTSLTTKVSIKDLTEAFYFLKTSALSTEEAMAGFAPLINILTGTNVKAQEGARALAGMYNTMGQSIGENLSPTEKMTKIADILTYTYAKQDVEMGELMAGYAKLAPYLAGLDDNFVDIVSTLGFLNTHLLRSSRAGTLTGQAIMNMTKSASQLASIFNITFDPNQPLNFLKTLDMIQKKMGDTSKLTTSQSEAIAKISATRGGVPIRLILGNYDEFKATLKDATDNFEGFAKKIADLRMSTVSAQMAEMKNILGVLTNDFISGVYGVGDFAEALKLLNETMASKESRNFANGLGIITNKVGGSVASLWALVEVLTTVGEEENKIARMTLGETLKQLFKGNEEQIKAVEKAIEKEKERKTLVEAEKQANEMRIAGNKEDEEIINHQVALMKALGANELDVAKYRLDSLKTNIDDYDITQQKLLLQKAENNLIQEQTKYRKQITDNMTSVGLGLLKTMGAEESQIITMKMRELEVDREKMGEGAYLAQMETLRLSRIQAIVSEKLKERQVQASLILEYQKADETERARIRRTIELRKLSATELTSAYEKSPADARIIDQNLNKFKPAQQEAVTKMYAEKYGLEYEDIKDIITDTSKEANPQITENNQALRDLTEILRSLNTNIGVGNPKKGYSYAVDMTKGQTIQDRIAVDANVDLRTAIANININLPDNALASVAEEAGRMVTESLTNNEEMAKKIAKIIRPYV